MNDRKKKTRKIVKASAGVAAVILIALILFITNGFVGNPISSAMADKAIIEYVDQNYSSFNLDVEKAQYNFKFSQYEARASSKTSVDTNFTIYYQDGEVFMDDYETYVLGKFNTLRRFEEEYAAFVKPILAQIEGLAHNTSLITIEKEEFVTANEEIKLDMAFDRRIPIEYRLIIRNDLTDNSIPYIADILKQAHSALVKEECTFQYYDVFSETDGVLVMISNVTPEDIESGELEDRLLRAQGNEYSSGISVFIKDINAKEQ